MKIPFCGTHISMTVSSVERHVFHYMWAAVKSVLLKRPDEALIPFLFVEREVLGDPAHYIDTGAANPTFDPAVYDDIKTARSKSNALCAEDHSSASIKSVLAKKQVDLVGVDKTFTADVRFWTQLLGPQSGALLYAKVDSIMPANDGPWMDKSALAQRLGQILKSGLAKFCNQGVSTEIDELHKAVVGISAGKAPKLRANATEVPRGKR